MEPSSAARRHSSVGFMAAVLLRTSNLLPPSKDSCELYGHGYEKCCTAYCLPSCNDVRHLVSRRSYPHSDRFIGHLQKPSTQGNR